MAKDKRSKSKKSSKRSGGKRKDPDPNAIKPPNGSSGLTKDIAEIRKAAVKVDYHKREVLHELWPELLLHHISQVESSIWRSYGAYKEGLTPGEIEELKEVRRMCIQARERLNVIYFRLKFKS